VACVTQQPAEVTLAILVSVLTLVRLVVADDTPSCSTRGAVTGHVTSNATDYRTFNASLSICRADSSDSDSQNQQCNEHFHCKPPLSQPNHKKRSPPFGSFGPAREYGKRNKLKKELEIVYQSQQ
jgi:hypothetical protein